MRKHTSQKFVVPYDSELKGVLAVVAHRTGAKFYLKKGNKGQVVCVHELDFPEGRKPIREGKRAEQGRATPSSKTTRGHSVLEPKTSTHDLEAQKFAKQIADILENGRLEHQFEKLILVAEPQFLGSVKSELSRSLAKIPTTVIHREVLHEDEIQVEQLFQESAKQS